MTATNVIVDNFIDYTTQLDNITTQLENLNSNLSSLVSYLGAVTENAGYFSRFPRTPSGSSYSTWTGITNTVYISTTTPLTVVGENYRVEGENIDFETFVNTVNTTTIGSSTVIDSLILSKNTLGSIFGKTRLEFYQS